MHGKLVGQIARELSQHLEQAPELFGLVDVAGAVQGGETSGHRRRRGGLGWPLLAFLAAAVAPFLPYLFSSPRGLWYVFQYHLERPLQIESVLGTPMLFGKLIGAMQAGWGYSHGSQSLAARGAGVAADLSGGLTLLVVAGVYLLIWRRRARLRAATRDQAIAVLARILAVMTFGKVLSPQYFIWVLPAWALVAARDSVLAILGGLTLLLTGIGFPKYYWDMLSMHHGPLALLIVRNVMPVATFCFAAWRLWEMRAGGSFAEAGTPTFGGSPTGRDALPQPGPHDA